MYVPARDGVRELDIGIPTYGQKPRLAAAVAQGLPC